MKQTIDSSLRNDALKWWENLSGWKQCVLLDRYSNLLKGGILLTEEDREYIYQQETNPKAIIGSGVEEKKWFIEYLPHNRYCYIIDGQDRLIATTSDIGSEKRISEDEMRANAKLICEAVNNYPASKKQLELEAQCQSLLKDENQALRDNNAELLKALEDLSKVITMSDLAFTSANVRALNLIKKYKPNEKV